MRAGFGTLPPEADTILCQACSQQACESCIIANPQFRVCGSGIPWVRRADQKRFAPLREIGSYVVEKGSVVDIGQKLPGALDVAAQHPNVVFRPRHGDLEDEMVAAGLHVMTDA